MAAASISELKAYHEQMSDPKAKAEIAFVIARRLREESRLIELAQWAHEAFEYYSLPGNSDSLSAAADHPQSVLGEGLPDFMHQDMIAYEFPWLFEDYLIENQSKRI